MFKDAIPRQSANFYNIPLVNLAELYGIGLWGVPSFKYGDVKVFGQDRLDCIEQAIVKGFEKN